MDSFSAKVFLAILLIVSPVVPMRDPLEIRQQRDQYMRDLTNRWVHENIYTDSPDQATIDIVDHPNDLEYASSTAYLDQVSSNLIDESSKWAIFWKYKKIQKHPRHAFFLNWPRIVHAIEALESVCVCFTWEPVFQTDISVAAKMPRRNCKYFQVWQWTMSLRRLWAVVISPRTVGRPLIRYWHGTNG